MCLQDVRYTSLRQHNLVDQKSTSLLTVTKVPPWKFDHKSNMPDWKHIQKLWAAFVKLIVYITNQNSWGELNRFDSPVRKGIFLPQSTFGADSLMVSVHPPCTLHVKDPTVYVRVRWTMETLKHPACTLGWVARLCRSWLSLGRATKISYWRNPIRTIQL